jgi:aminopeptidase N
MALLLMLLATPASAQRLPTKVRPEHYDLAFDVNLAAARFSGIELIRVHIDEPTTRIVLHAVDLTFGDVAIESGGRRQRGAVALDRNAQTATLTVRRTLAAGMATIHIRYAGTLNDTLRGFYLSRANGRRYAVTQMESTDARRAFPSFDEPAFKATFDVTLTIDRGDTAISNGRLLSDTPGPGHGRHTLKFDTSPVMSSYLVAMAVGDFTCLEGAADGIPIRVCATPDKAHLGRLALESAQHILTFYNRYYDIKYPFGKLDVVAVPDFAAGAMENTAAIFYRETDLLAETTTAATETRKNIASVLAHEMAHQWFGDLVTMRWWDDLWLNEGFATWMANRPLAAWKPEWDIQVDEALETQVALDLDALASTRPIHSRVESPGEIDGSFDAIAYEKGGAILRMVEAFVGEEPFRKGVNVYLARHAYGNATSEDFWTAIAESTGKPVDRILSTFVSQPGAPLIDASLSCRQNQSTLSLSQERFGARQSSVADNRSTRWYVPLCLTRPGGGVNCELIPPDGASQPLASTGCVPWAFVNAGAAGYYRTLYPSAMLTALAPHIESALSAPERLVLLSDEWALVRVGRQSLADYLTIAAGFGHERVSGVLGQLTARLTFIRNYLTTPDTRPAFESWVRRLFEPLANELSAVPDVAATSGDSGHNHADDERQTLRARVLEVLGATGRDAATIAAARTAVDRALSGGPALASATAESQLASAARGGDAALFNKLLEASARAVSPEERYLYLHALAYFEDPALIRRALALSLTPQLRTQDTPQFLGRFLANPDTNAEAWKFVKAHWSDLGPKALNFLGDLQLVSAMGSFCDRATRDDIAGFFTTHQLPTASRALTQTLEKIDSCIRLKESQTASLRSWLESVAN